MSVTPIETLPPGTAYELDPEHTLPRVLARQAEATPDRVLIREVRGTDRTYGEVLRASRQWSRVLADLGVGAGDRVATMLYPGADSFCTWVGLGALRAIDTGVNTGLRGRMLRDALALSQARVAVVHASLLRWVLEASTDLSQLPLHTVVVVGADPDRSPAAPRAASPVVMHADEHVPLAEPLLTDGPDQWDICTLTFTSGTTGPSKGVLVPWGQMYTFARVLFPIEEFGPDDVFFSPWPVYHTSGRFGAYLMTLQGGTVVYTDQFHLSTWIEEAQRFGVTAMVTFPPVVETLRQANDEQVRQLSALRFLTGTWGADHHDIAERFSIGTRSCFAMTECPPVIVTSGWRYAHPPTIGQARTGFPGYEMRLVDEHDQAVGPGQSGQLIIRSATPWTMNAGYFADPEATARVWRNGWFHTGDTLRTDAEGNYYFVDRTTDSIRRREEHISSYEVEAYLFAHPAVLECAAVAAQVPGNYDREVKVVVRLADGAAVTHAELHDQLAATMPRFMVPRFIEFVDEFPRTPTLKIRKVELRQTALNATTWDAVTGGFVVESSG